MVYAAGEASDLPERTIRRAREAIGVEVNGHTWTLPDDLTSTI